MKVPVGRPLPSMWPVRSAIHELEQARSTKKPASIAEVSCSGGVCLLADMRHRCPNTTLTGGDLCYARNAGQARREDAGYPACEVQSRRLARCHPDSYDAMVLPIVLEHIRDVRRRAHITLRMLKPGGVAEIELPAGPELCDDYDRQLQRFRPCAWGICGVVEHAGLVVERRNYLGALIYPAFYLAKTLSQRRPKPAAEREAHRPRRSA